jgi:hypothetical protein
MPRHPHILNASTNLLGICFVVIGGLKLTNRSNETWADEIAWAATGLLFVAILSSYLAIRHDGHHTWLIAIADISFIVGVVALIGSLFAGVVQL